MIVYLCDSCKATIQPDAIRQGDAILLGDRAYCRDCNPRKVQPPPGGAAEGRTLCCDGCEATISTAALRLGEARVVAGKLLCGTCLVTRKAVSGTTGALAPTRRRLDWPYLVGVLGIIAVLPILSALVTWRLAGRGDGSETAAGPDSGSEDLRTPALLSQVETLQESNDRLRSELAELTRTVREATTAAPRAGAPEDDSRARAQEEQLSHTLDRFERTIRRLEGGLSEVLEATEKGGAPGPAGGSRPVEEASTEAAQERPSSTAPKEQEAWVPTADPYPQLLRALTHGQLPPGIDLGALVDHEDPSVRTLACKLAGVVYADRELVDRTVLSRIKALMRDPDPGVQRSAMTAAGLITGERYVAWDDLSADEYELMSRLRRLWDSVRQDSSTPEPPAEPR